MLRRAGSYVFIDVIYLPILRNVGKYVPIDME
jgi:hypothetical protein